jgi:hypothetical protein
MKLCYIVAVSEDRENALALTYSSQTLTYKEKE